MIISGKFPGQPSHEATDGTREAQIKDDISLTPSKATDLLPTLYAEKYDAVIQSLLGDPDCREGGAKLEGDKLGDVDRIVESIYRGSATVRGEVTRFDGVVSKNQPPEFLVSFLDVDPNPEGKPIDRLLLLQFTPFSFFPHGHQAPALGLAAQDAPGIKVRGNQKGKDPSCDLAVKIGQDKSISLFDLSADDKGGVVAKPLKPMKSEDDQITCGTILIALEEFEALWPRGLSRFGVE